MFGDPSRRITNRIKFEWQHMVKVVNDVRFTVAEIKK